VGIDILDRFAGHSAPPYELKLVYSSAQNVLASMITEICVLHCTFQCYNRRMEDKTQIFSCEVHVMLHLHLQAATIVQSVLMTTLRAGRLRNRGSIFGEGNRLLCPPRCTDSQRSPPSLLSNGYMPFFARHKAARTRIWPFTSIQL
jgi:hypothetical protein